MTEAEHVLWRELRGRRLDVKFRRQEPVSGYIVDFYAPSLSLAVEVDGEVHQTRQRDDMVRDAKLRSLNIRVLRFSNDAVINDLRHVLDEIRAAIAALRGSTSIQVTTRGYPARAPSGRGGQGGASNV